MSGPESRSPLSALHQASDRISRATTGPDVLAAAVRLAPSVVPAARHASVTLSGAGGLRTAAASSPVADRFDAAQYELDEGPCVTAARTGLACLVPSLRTERRWPRLADRYRGRDEVGSAFSVPLHGAGRLAGALNLTAPEDDAFADESYAAGGVLAAMTALALAAVTSPGEVPPEADELAERDDFLAVLAHDLRTGLTALGNAAEVVGRRSGQLDAAGREAVDVLTAEVSREQRLVVGLLDLARDPLGPARPVPVLPLVAEVVRESGQVVPVHAGPGTADLAVATHRVRVERILANLLDNAQRHAGGAVGVGVERLGRDVVLTVDDRGPGVPEHLREAVFAGAAVGTPGAAGSGLGLTLSRRAARRAGGDLRVEPRRGGGARLVLRLPCAEPE